MFTRKLIKKAVAHQLTGYKPFCQGNGYSYGTRTPTYISYSYGYLLIATQLLKTYRFKMGAAIYKRYLKWVLKLKCEKTQGRSDGR